MGKAIYTIDAFPDHAQLWRIDWIGGVAPLFQNGPARTVNPARIQLGFRFAPRIRELKEKRLYLLPGMTAPPELAPMVAGTINLRVISDHWFELSCPGRSPASAGISDNSASVSAHLFVSGLRSKAGCSGSVFVFLDDSWQCSTEGSEVSSKTA
jgi:hypothetical protein